MPPKRPGSRSGSSTASSSSSSSSGSGSSSSSSSDSSTSGSDSSSDSDTSASKTSRRSRRPGSSASSSAATSEAESPKKSSKKSQKSSSGNQNAKKSGALTRSRSASSAASTTESEHSPKKSSKDSKKSSSGKKDVPRAVPKKSATAKPMAKPVITKKLSDNDSDSDFGDFTLPKLAAKAIQAKRASEAAAAASLSPASQPSPSAKSLTGGSIIQPSKLAAATTSLTMKSASDASSTLSTATQQAAKHPAKSAGGAASSALDKSKIKSIFSESSGSSSGSSSETESPKKSSSAATAALTTPVAATGSAASKAKAAKKAASSAKKRSPSPAKLVVAKKTPSPSKTPGKRGRPAGSSSKKTSSLGAAAVASLAARATASANKLKTKKSISPVKRNAADSSASLSNSGDSSASSDSSDSNSDESPKKKSASATKASAAKVKAGKAKESVGKDDKSKKSKSQSTDSEGGKVTARPNTRKTRGTNVRKSRHVTGKNVSDSDSDLEVNFPGKAKNAGVLGTVPGTTPGSASKKKTAVLFPPVRKEIPGLQPIENRQCPMQGCDSSGHLGGRLDRHFLLESCPVYHNLTRKTCRDFRNDTQKRSNARKKALTTLATKSPMGSPTSDQRKNAQMIHEARSRFSENDIPVTEDMPEECEPDLNGFTSEWDLQIFREAQADASEFIEETMRGLPDTKQTRYIEMGSFEMEVWYQSPYPDDFGTLPKLYICEFCLKYHRSATQLKRHAAKCVWNHPPGDEIYRKEPISVFEICGKRYKQYCQSLCLLAKFFLDHKTLYFDVEPFLFYVMTTADSAGCHIVGYFSKEKNSVLNYNVSCILTLPPYQRQGFGRLLIDFSYLLSRVEGKIGSPEKPLSDLGLITYRAYWKDVILEYICNYPDKEISIKGFSEEMGINPNDIISTLQYMGMIKYWKGQHLILKREDLISDYLEKSRNRPKGREIYPSALKWQPYQPSAKERKQAERIKKNHEKQKKR